MELLQWNEKLWTYIKSHYVDGRDIYLAFDKHILEQLYDADDTEDSTESASQDLFNACRSGFIFGPSRVRMQPFVFTSQSDNPSLVLPFAVQQIIAAEEMVSGSDYSADSYYPHYCEAIGEGIINLHQCPISYRDFERIWSTLKSELLTQLKTSKSCITFDYGIGNKNKYRNFPLSQALLNIDDLSGLSERLNSSDLVNAQYLMTKVRRCCYLLSKRGQKKVHVEALANPIAEQVIDYMSSKFEVQVKRKRTIKKVEGKFFLYTETDGWDENYLLCYFDLDEKQLSFAQCNTALIQYIETYTVMAFTPDNRGNFSIQQDLSYDLSSGDLLLLYPKDLNSRFLGDLCAKFPEIDVNSIINHDINDDYILKSFSGFPQETYLADILPNKINQNNSLDMNKLSFEGGLVVNQQTRSYLVGYPPTKIYFNSTQIPLNELITVNCQSYTIKEFLQELILNRIDLALHIDYLGASISLNMVVDRKIMNDVFIGYPVINSNMDSDSCCLMDSNVSYFSHVSWSNSNIHLNRLLKCINDMDFINLMKTSTKSWITSTSEELKIVKNLIDSQEQSSNLNSYLSYKIKISRKLPASIVQTIRGFSSNSIKC
ncbi:hypothetical protein [Thalassotalea sediminis]|uniref:hypothetical protein n=1 Tax=Thalassotalea sediminis TaxID=1759089 RepID=UPI0025726811|nr:hypothetical protein [Thalassotalea sediminis]